MLENMFVESQPFICQLGNTEQCQHRLMLVMLKVRIGNDVSINYVLQYYALSVKFVTVITHLIRLLGFCCCFRPIYCNDEFNRKFENSFNPGQHWNTFFVNFPYSIPPTIHKHLLQVNQLIHRPPNHPKPIKDPFWPIFDLRLLK